jgi:hypothetical protein
VFYPRCPKCGLLLTLCGAVGGELLHAHDKTHEAKTDMGVPHAPEEPVETPKPVAYYYTSSATTTLPPTGYSYGG